MGSLDNFVCLHCITRPSPDREPDSDDEDIIALSWLLVNAKTPKVRICYDNEKLLFLPFILPKNFRQILLSASRGFFSERINVGGVVSLISRRFKTCIMHMIVVDVCNYAYFVA